MLNQSLISTLPNLSVINPNNGPLIILILIILIMTLCIFYMSRSEPHSLFQNRKYTFKFYGLKNESFYKFLLDLINIYIIKDFFTYNITIAFYEIKDNKLIRLSNDCHFNVSSNHNLSINDLFSNFEGWSNSAFNEEYDHIIVKVEINS